MRGKLIFWSAVCLLLWACEEAAPVYEEPVRAIKTITVSEVGAGQVRRFSAVVQASDTSTLSFQVAGNVQEIRVDAGDQVLAGDIIAVLDKSRYELEVQAADADLARSQADLHQKELEFDRQKQLFERGWVSQAVYDQADAALQSARASVDFATSRLNQARRDLRNTELRAPFDGSIADRMIEPFQEVASGQALFEINASGALEVEFNVPETEIAPLAIGQELIVRFPQQSTPTERLDGPLETDGVVTQLSTAASQGNAFPVTAGLLNPPPVVRPGMTAEVALTIPVPGRQGGYLVPLVAISPGDEQPPEVGLFRFDPDAQVVRRVTATIDGVRDNNLLVVDGIDRGDIIVVAGVSFLQDGQAVKLLRP